MHSPSLSGHPALLLLAASVGWVSCAHYADWQEGSCDLSDAEQYLQHFGIQSGLPKLHVRYGHFLTQEYHVHGADTTFAKGKEELHEAPRVTWEQTGKYTEAKYALLMVDADNTQGMSENAKWKPHVHWLKVNTQKVSTSGAEIFPYEPPLPKSGKHRYILVLFQQVKPGELLGFMGKRDGWDFEGFMKANKEALRPVSYNFFVVDADLQALE